MSERSAIDFVPTESYLSPILPRSSSLEPQDDPSIPTEEVLLDRFIRKPVRDFERGQWWVKSLRTEYLPQERGEENEDYEARLRRSYLFNGVKRAAVTLSGKPFTKPIRRSADMAAPMMTFLEDVDLHGTRLEVYARALLYNATLDGIGFIQVDFPRVVDAEGKPQKTVTLDRIARDRLRPYWRHIAADQVLGYRLDQDGNLTQFRYYDCSFEASGRYGVGIVHRIRVFEPGVFTVWKYEVGSNDWEIELHGATSYQEIPILAIPMHGSERMSARPPLRDFTDINIVHYQSTSDQRHILHLARVPFLFGSGIKDDDEELIIAPNVATIVETPGATLDWKETQGGSIGAGKEDLEFLQAQMAEAALQLLIPEVSNVTATAASYGVADSVSEMQVNAMSLTDGLNRAILLTAKIWASIEPKAAANPGYVDVNTDFAFSYRDIEEMRVMLDVRRGKDLSRKYFIAALDKKNLFGMEFNAKDNDAELEKEAAEEMSQLFKMESITAAAAGDSGKPSDGGSTKREMNDDAEKSKRAGKAKNDA
jgi:hypothetical protein